MPVRKRVDRRRQELPDSAWDWLHGEDYTEWSFFLDDAELAEMWGKHGAEVQAEHVRQYPGTRPKRWWNYDAPRISAPGAFWDCKLAEPRRQVGGSGRPLPVAVPHSTFGILGLMTDVDADNLPVFESEATYLDRHGLLTAAERRRLKPEDFEPEMLDAG